MEGEQREKNQGESKAKEKMESPSHPLHLFEKQSSLDTDDSSNSSPSCAKQETFSAAGYANFFAVDTKAEDAAAQPSPLETLFLASTNSFNHRKVSPNLSSQADKVPLLHSELGFQCSRTREILMDFTSSIQNAFQEQGQSRTSILSRVDEEETSKQDQECANNFQGEELRAAICEHPLYPEMVLAHIGILKIGAPRDLQAKLDDDYKTLQRRFYKGRHHTSKLDQDPELDNFMRSYTLMLTSFREDLEEPFHKFMQFADKTTKELEDLCGHYVETKPEEEDNFVYDMGLQESTQDSDENSENTGTLPGEEQTNVKQFPTDIDESVVVDPDAPEAELRKALKAKYGQRHIGALKAEFNRVRRKGKLPDAARRILKDWFNLHAHWPYPSEMEKAYLQQLCNLTLKQVNNWFINERKRHWNSEERSIYQSPQLTDQDAPPPGPGLLELN